MHSEMLSGILVLVAVFIIITVVNVIIRQFNQNYTTETALLSQGSDSEQVQGIFIRDEQVLNYKGSGIISYEVPDGGKLGIGTVIAEVYSSEHQIEIKQRIQQLKNELSLLERISNPGTTKTAQPSNIADLFTQNYKEYLYQREQMHLSDLQSRREEIAVLLSTYQLITGKDSGYELQMQAIQAEISSLEQAQEQPLDVIIADEAAYFVSYADGYESSLTLKDVRNLTAEQLEGIQDHTESNAVGKLIDSYQWVLAAVVDNTEKRYKQGQPLTLKFASTSETVDGEVTSLNADSGDDRTVICITCEVMTHDLVQHRTEAVELIRGEYQGIRVPRTALHFRNITEAVKDPETGKTRQVTTEYRGVYVLDGEQPEFRKLDVVYEGADYVISAQHTGNDYLALYDSIITKGIDADGQ